MAQLPSIGAVTTSTNSLSRGYYGFLACVDSWANWVDELLIVDGGTSDDTYDVLKSWVPRSNWRIMSEDRTLWGSRGRWHPAQWTLNTTAGLENLQTDWAFVINSDYVLEDKTTNIVRQYLAENSDALWATFNRRKLTREGQTFTPRMGAYALNLKRIKQLGLRIGLGVNNSSNHPSDKPIIQEEETTFIDPVNGCLKTVYRGPWLSGPIPLPIRCTVYGHYFFNFEQLKSKVSEFHLNYSVRYAKRAPVNSKKMERQLSQSFPFRILPLAKEEQKEHPLEIKRVLREYYHEQMVGNDVRQNTNGVIKGGVARFNQAISTILFQFRGMPSIQDRQQWATRSGGKIKPLDLRELYEIQDKFLPKYARIEWSRG